MRIVTAIGALCTLMLALVAQPALACTPVKGYRTPTNFELVREAELIVLARVVDGPVGAGDLDPHVKLEPVKVLKGELPAGSLHVAGSIAWNGKPIPSLPTTLAQSHFSSGMGACIRIFYPKGGLVVAMFVRTPDSMKAQYPDAMMQLAKPFARSVEDVVSDGDVWVQAVADYVRTQQGVTDAGMVPAAEGLRERLRAQPATILNQAMADDLAFYLRTVRDGGKRPGGAVPFWTLLASPNDSFATLVDPAKKQRSILRCAAGQNVIEMILPERPGLTDLALQIGEERFVATPFAFDWKQIPKGSAGRLALTDRLRAALASSPAPASILSAVGATVAAEPLDALQKLGVQCARMATTRAG